LPFRFLAPELLWHHCIARL